MVFSGPIVVFPELYIQHPMLLIFDAPMPSHTHSKSFQIVERTEIIPRLYGCFIANDSRRFDPSHSD